jgi:formate C-acetyltransferase
LDKIEALLRSHFALGGTLINMNVLDKKKILEAHKDPSKYPDLVVRVTGFSAYFASLSPELRRLVVNRIIAEDWED